MGFKVDTSFLRFLSMGALASQRVMEGMKAAGLRPIELERYSCSNKIWMTKVKRLRLPDLLCVDTGLRVEVRAKSDLAIRMSDAPANPKRRWFAALNGDDLIAFVHCREDDGKYIFPDQPELFWVRDIKACREKDTRLGPPKSASEGSERDRVWPTIVPKKTGKVVAVTKTTIQTEVKGGRAQTYQLRNLTPYIRSGDEFLADTQFIAGLPRRKATFSQVKREAWDPTGLLKGDEVDRYVAVKALATSGKGSARLLKERLADADPRVALEAAGSLAKRGDDIGLMELISTVTNPKAPYLRMEAVFLLSELRDSPLSSEAADALADIASRASFSGDEVRQAAIWGLGRAGLMKYSRLSDHLDADEENERVHAMVAFAEQLPGDVVRALTQVLVDQKATARKKAAVAYVLSMLTDVKVALPELISIATHGGDSAAWAKAVLGSLPEGTTRGLIRDALAEQIRPVQMLAVERNWTKSDAMQMEINFVRKQTVFLS